MTSVTPSEEVRSLRAGSPLGPGDDDGQWERRLASTWRACNTTMPGEGWEGWGERGGGGGGGIQELSTMWHSGISLIKMSC